MSSNSPFVSRPVAEPTHEYDADLLCTLYTHGEELFCRGRQDYFSGNLDFAKRFRVGTGIFRTRHHRRPCHGDVKAPKTEIEE